MRAIASDGCGVRRFRPRVHHFCNSEIEDLHRTVAGERDVRRLEIAMHDSALVCRVERVGELKRDGADVSNRHAGCPGASHPVGECLAVDELQHDRVKVVALVGPVDAGDVRMIERGERARFTGESRQALGVRRHTGGQDLQRDVASQLRVVRTVDLAHAAAAECGDNLVVTEASAG